MVPFRLNSNTIRNFLGKVEGNIEDKRHIIGSIYDEKWTILENKGRTGKINIADQLIYQINKTLGHKNTGVRTKIRTNSGLVPRAGVEPDRYLNYLITLIIIDLYLNLIYSICS